MKLFAFFRHDGAGAARAADAARALAAHGAVERCVLNNCVNSSQVEATGYRGVLEIRGRALPVDELAELISGCGGAEIYVTNELVEKEPPRGVFPGIKLIAPWALKTGVDQAEGRHHWDEHVPLALSVHVGACAYVRHWVETRLTAPAPAYQGIAILWFPTEADLREHLFDRPESANAVARDVADFVGDNCAIATREELFKEIAA